MAIPQGSTTNNNVEMDPLYQARILLLAETAPPSGLIFRLQGSGAFLRTTSTMNDAFQLVTGWHPALFILQDWSARFAPWLMELSAYPACAGLPVLAIGMDGDANAMSALDAGASAYVSTPYSETLLLAQASALLKKNQHWKCLPVEQGSLIQVNPGSCRVWVNGEEIRLSRRLFRFLHYLALHPDRTFSSREIANVLTDGRSLIQENSVAAQVHRLRKCLEKAGAAEWLETVHGFGYRLSLPPKNAIDVKLS
ncbi:MAG: winged helix-turn-helix transcriptional regulator [Acidithiobacillus ferrooxidans]